MTDGNDSARERTSFDIDVVTGPSGAGPTCPAIPETPAPEMPSAGVSDSGH